MTETNGRMQRHGRVDVAEPYQQQAQHLGVIVLAAGKGTRMRSERAKVLHHLAGKPLLTRVIQTCRGLHPGRLVVVVGHQAATVQEACREDGVVFALQKEQRGTGDAVRAATEQFAGFRGDILIVSGDVPLLTPQTLARFVAEHHAHRATLSVLTAQRADPAQYGRVIRRANGQVIRIVEARDASVRSAASGKSTPGYTALQPTFSFPRSTVSNPQMPRANII